MKKQISFPDGTVLETDVSKKGLIAVHRPTDESEKGYVLTEVASLRVIEWFKRKSDAVKRRNELESLLVSP